MALLGQVFTRKVSCKVIESNWSGRTIDVFLLWNSGEIDLFAFFTLGKRLGRVFLRYSSYSAKTIHSRKLLEYLLFWLFKLATCWFSHILMLFHWPKGWWNKSLKYEKLGKYWSYCTRNQVITNVIANTKKYLQSDWLRGVQYRPYLYSVFNNFTLLLNKKKSTFDLYSLKTN